MSPIYVDSSAWVKLLVAERETATLEAFVERREAEGDWFLSSDLLRVELHRFAVRERLDPERIVELLGNVDLVALGRSVVDLACSVPRHVKALDALHLGTAMMLMDEAEGEEAVRTVLTYDVAMAQAARDAGFEVVSPGAEAS